MLWTIAFSFVLFSCTEEPLPEPTPVDPQNPTPPPAQTYSAAGSVQKGPFTQGTSITIQPLDDSLNPTGKQYQTKTTDDAGTFSVDSEIESRYVEIIATGYYYNEIEGKVSSSTLTLRSLSDLTESGKTNVNLLTTLESDRIRALSKEGKSLSEARSQAEKEILEVFHIPSGSVACFDKMDITGANTSDAILLAISASLQAGRSVGELSELISKIAGDIASTGALPTASLSDQILESSKKVDAEKVRENLKKRYEQLGVKNFTIPPFEDYLDVNGNGKVDKEDAWIILGSKEHTIGAQGGSFTINLQHSKPFEVIIDDADWVRQEEKTKAYLEDAVLHFAVDPSDDGDDRNAVIRIKDSESTYSELFHLTQLKKVYLEPETADYNLSYESGSLEIPVSVNVNYDVSIKQDGDWLQYVQTKAIRNETLVFAYTYNGSPSPRSAIITLTGEGVAKEITVVQEANQGEIVLNVTRPGTLSTLMSMEDLYQVINLKIVGTLNQDDLGLLVGGTYVGGSNVVGGGEAHFECDWNVETLDLSEMRTESGKIGESYDQNSGRNFFCNVPSLKKVIMPKNIDIVGAYSFNKCIGLETIEWGEDSKIEEIEGNLGNSGVAGMIIMYYHGAFMDCISLTEVTLPKSISTFKAGAFMNCISLKTLTFPDGGKIKELLCSRTSYSTGISTHGYSMGHLWGCTSLETINLPDNLRTIDIDAFYGTPFKKIVIPETVKYLTTEYLFCDCERLEDVTLPSSVTEYSKGMFSGCVNLKSIKGNGKITKYCEGCFKGCSSDWVVLDPEAEYEASVFAEMDVESVVFPNGFKTVPEKMFNHCTSLKTLDLGEVETIGASAFNGCPLRTVTIPKSVSYVGEYAFGGYIDPDSQYGDILPLDDAYIYGADIELAAGAIGASRITIGNTVRRISCNYGLGAQLSNVTEINFESGSVCEYFNIAGNSNIKRIELPSSLVEIGDKAFVECENLESIQIPAKVKSIGKSAFAYCEDLESVTLSNGLEIIGDQAFYKCTSLESITIPHNVTAIGKDAFRYDKYLEEVHMKSIEPPFLNSVKEYDINIDEYRNVYAFADCQYLEKIQVPDEGLEAYRSMWSAYADIIVGGEPEGLHNEGGPFASVVTMDAEVSTTSADSTAVVESICAIIYGRFEQNVELPSPGFGFLFGNSPEALSVPYGNTITNSDRTFRCEIKDLQPETTYYYRARAMVDGMEFLGEIKSFTTAALDNGTNDYWHLVGNFNGWVVGDESYLMAKEGNWYVFKGFVADGQAIKFNSGNSWNINRGGNFVAVNTAIPVTQGGPDMFVPAGTYDVYMNSSASKVYFMEVGKTP